MSGIDPSPQTTLVILLGASKWPLSSLRNSPAYARSANRVKDYFCNQTRYGLPPDNWLDLFDQRQRSPNEVDKVISNFLQRRILNMEQAGTPIRDLLFYYIGHGVFASGREQAYHLALRSTRDDNIGISSLPLASLAETLKGKAKDVRRIVILDCCFAAESFRYMQSAPDEVARQQVIHAFHEEEVRRDIIPQNGTALLCSSSHKEASFLLPDESGTMFSEALVDALSQGIEHRPDKTHLSLRNLQRLTEDALASLVGDSAPKTFLSSPDQSDGDVSSIPFFPNPLSPIASPHSAILPKSSGMFSSPPFSKQRKRQNSPAVLTILMLLILVLLGGVGIGIYTTFTGKGWNTSHEQASPIVMPSKAGIIPGGIWITPDNNFTVTRGETLELSAHAYPTNNGDPAIAYVQFTGYWSGWNASHWPVLARVHPTAGTDVFTFTWNLTYQGKPIPSGAVKVSFDVYDVAGDKNLAPNGIHAGLLN
jgi:Caspase domain.